VPKRVGDATYAHASALADLSSAQQAQVRRAAQALPPRFRWSLVRVRPGEVMFARTTSFASDPHPALLASVLVRGGRASQPRQYASDNPPIYHRKEQMLSARHPSHASFAALTQAEDQAGLLSRPDIGRKQSWERLLAKQGYEITGHRLHQKRGSRALDLDAIIAQVLEEPVVVPRQGAALELWVEPYAGMASAARALHTVERLRPLITYQGGKHRYGGSILGALGLSRGAGARRYWLNDAGPSARVLAALVSSELRDQVLTKLAAIEPGERSWRWLASAPVPTDRVTFVAVWLALQAGSPLGKPVMVEDGWWKTHGYATLSPSARRKGFRYRMNPAALAKKLRRMEHALADWPIVTTTGPAIEMPVPAQVDGPTVVFLDPPYVGRTGYLRKQTRQNVETIARRWHDAGATVIVSESEPVHLGRGEDHVSLIGDDARPRPGQKYEWLTILRSRQHR
jgi:hypothetical protein